MLKQEIHETLLYIAYNLHNQNQIITIEAIRQPLGWLYIEEIELKKEISWLVENEFLGWNSNNELFLTGNGKIESVKINKVRTKTDFNRMIKCATDSRAYLDYCEEIYGYRMYLFNMMDKPQLDYLFNTIQISESDSILDLGCGTGSILNNLVEKYKCHGTGIDQLNTATVQKCSKKISYIEGDIDELPPIAKTDITLAIDSLYFSTDLDKLLKSIENNRLYIFYSQYIFDEANKDKAVLHQDNTRIAGSLQKIQLKYRVIDYSTNECALYENALRILPKYKNSLTQEGNRDLFKNKMRENKSGKELYDKGLARRYLYIVE